MKRYHIDELGRITESIFGALVEYDEAMREISHWKNAHAGMVSAEKAVFADRQELQARLSASVARGQRLLKAVCAAGLYTPLDENHDDTDRFEKRMLQIIELAKEVGPLTTKLTEANARAERFRQMHGDAVRAHAQAVWDQPWEGETPDNKVKAIIDERDKLKTEVERLTQAHDHQRNMAGTMLREAERNGRERDIAVEQLATAEDQMGSDITEARSAHIEALKLIDAWDKCDDPTYVWDVIENLQDHLKKYKHLLK